MGNLFNSYHNLNRFANWKFKSKGLKLNEVQLENFNLEYWDSGQSNKPVLLLLQAFAAESKFSWLEQARLTKSFRLIVPNLIYFGKSTMEPKSYHVDQQVKALELLLDHLMIYKLYVCGSSYGGIVAAELALSSPEKIDKLVLVNTPIKFLRDDDNDEIMQKIGVETKEELLLPRNPEHLRQLFKFTYYKNKLAPKFLFKGIFTHLYQNQDDKDRLVRTFIQDQKKDREKDYKFEVPVALIWGKEDYLVPFHVAEEMKDHVGENATLITIENTRHMPNLEKPKLFNQLLTDFLLKNE